MSDTVKPVQWTNDGYPVFTDPSQFRAWEKQYRQNLVDEISEVLNEEAVRIAVQAVESREAFIVEEIQRLAAQIDRIEADTLQVSDQFRDFRELYGDHLKNLHFVKE